MVGVEFTNCDLAFADFTGADLSYARFIDCNLYQATFDRAVLYTTWFYESNLTRAAFHDSYLLGLRLRNVDLTKTHFDDAPAVGLERKTGDSSTSGLLRLPVAGGLPCDAPLLEKQYSGIQVTVHPRTVAFLRDGDSESRRRIRVAETAKYLKIAYGDNAYEEKAQHYYVVERRHRRRALQGSVRVRARRAQDFVFGDLVWRYGTSIMRPVVILGANAFLAAATTIVAPSLDHGTGLFPEGGRTPYSLHGWDDGSLTDFLNVLYFFLTAPAGGSQDHLQGWVKLVFVIYLLTALWLIALTFEASTRRLASTR